jgi:hypothetical protein
MKKFKRPKPTRRELTAICKRVFELCKQYDAGIICEVTSMSPDHEDSLRIEAEEGGYEYTGKPNLGFAYVYLTFPNDLGKKENELMHKINESDDICRVFASFGPNKTRIKGSVRSDELNLKK